MNEKLITRVALGLIAFATGMIVGLIIPKWLVAKIVNWTNNNVVIKVPDPVRSTLKTSYGQVSKAQLVAGSSARQAVGSARKAGAAARARARRTSTSTVDDT